MRQFRFYFNNRRQWIDVTLYKVHPTTFERWGGGRWEYYQPETDRGRGGLFGTMHFVADRVRSDVVAHCLIHLYGDIMRSRGKVWTAKNEETIALQFDELTRNFWREYNKLGV